MVALRGHVFATARGWMGVATSQTGIAYVTRPFVADTEAKCELARLAPSISFESERQDSLALAFAAKLGRYFAGERVEFDEPVDLNGASRFSQEVLAAVRAIPFGEVKTYAQIATQIGRPKASRPVGQVVARNPVPIIIPCHRVIGSDGGLRGFGWGLDIKKWLLELEGRNF